MKKVLFIMFALMTTAWASAQVEDQLALKRLVDTFSNLADVKDVKSQMDLFTDDAEVHSKAGEHVSVMKGKEQNGKWLIKRRESNFMFTTVDDMK